MVLLYLDPVEERQRDEDDVSSVLEKRKSDKNLI